MLLQLLLLTTSLNTVLSLTYCQAGTYEFLPPLGDREVCELCLPGTFMPHHDHRYKECFDCAKVEDPAIEIEALPCNRTHDIVIECVDGYYRSKPGNPNEKAMCVKCSECEYPYFEVRACQKDYDTGCCPGENYDSFINEDGVPSCKERAWFCRVGQFFSLDSFECLLCPGGTFMNIDYHTMTQCIKCQETSKEHLPIHAKIIYPCTNTNQAEIGCEEGYYLNHSMGHTNTDIGCSRCTHCNTTHLKFTGRECDGKNDTVCCAEADMEVVVTKEGPECQMPMPVTSPTSSTSPSKTTSPGAEQRCGINQYLNDSDLCQPCPEGTFTDECSHGFTTCTDCKNIGYSKLMSTCHVQSKVTENEKDDLESRSVLVYVILAISLALNVCFGIWVYKLKKTAIPANTGGEQHSRQYISYCRNNGNQSMTANPPETDTSDPLLVQETPAEAAVNTNPEAQQAEQSEKESKSSRQDCRNPPTHIWEDETTDKTQCGGGYESLVEETRSRKKSGRIYMATDNRENENTSCEERGPGPEVMTGVAKHIQSDDAHNKCTKPSASLDEEESTSVHLALLDKTKDENEIGNDVGNGSKPNDDSLLRIIKFGNRLQPEEDEALNESLACDSDYNRFRSLDNKPEHKRMKRPFERRDDDKTCMNNHMLRKLTLITSEV